MGRPRCALIYGPFVFVLAVLLYPVYWLLTRPAHAGNVVSDDAYRAPVNPDWRFEHEDERSG